MCNLHGKLVGECFQNIKHFVMDIKILRISWIDILKGVKVSVQMASKIISFLSLYVDQIVQDDLFSSGTDVIHGIDPGDGILSLGKNLHQIRMRIICDRKALEQEIKSRYN